MNKVINMIVFAVLSAVLPVTPAIAGKVDAKAARALFATNTCDSCHAANARTTGPSLKEIAKRYQGKSVEKELGERIRSGSTGRWGDMAHPSYEAMDAQEAELMAKWILGGAPK